MEEIGELFISIDGEKYGATLKGTAPNLFTDNITFKARLDQFVFYLYVVLSDLFCSTFKFTCLEKMEDVYSE